MQRRSMLPNYVTGKLLFPAFSIAIQKKILAGLAVERSLDPLFAIGLYILRSVRPSFDHKVCRFVYVFLATSQAFRDLQLRQDHRSRRRSRRNAHLQCVCVAMQSYAFPVLIVCEHLERSTIRLLHDPLTSTILAGIFFIFHKYVQEE